MNRVSAIYQASYNMQKTAETEYGEALPETSRAREIFAGLLGTGAGTALGRRGRQYM